MVRKYGALSVERPDLASEWHPEKNGELDPSDVAVQSNRKVWWLGECGHEWQAMVYDRSRGAGCPYCAGRKVLPGFNDLATVRPDLVTEWHPGKNGGLSPEDVGPGSGKSAWWRHWCEETGSWHEWKTTVKNRSRGSGCPYCSGRKVLPGFNDLATVRPDLAAEWHPGKNGELTAKAVSSSSNKSVWWLGSCGHEWRAKINSRSNGTGCPYCAGRKVLPGFNDLATTRPDLAAEWHPTRNAGLAPEDVVAGCNKEAWWRHWCEETGSWHEWRAKINNRSNGTGCPYCAGRKVLPGFNDLATTRPDLAAEWHPTRNGSMAPNELTVASGKLAWWRHWCEETGSWHEWRQAVFHRTQYGHGCPYCGGRKALPGFNDLATARPDLAAEWHPTRNWDLSPETVPKGSEKRVWWKCGKCGHEWRAPVAARVRGSGCPRCHGKVVVPGVNDLATVRPELASEWHPEKNGSLTAADVMAGSSAKVWWLGSCGHEWQAMVCGRSQGTGCPYCSGRRVLPGFNDLATVRPDLAAEWHPGKNGKLEPSDVTCSSRQRVWWLGSCGHEWKAYVYDRSLGGGCPVCAGKTVLPGFNDLATVAPRAARQWHPTMNGGLSPSDFTSGSSRMVWWRGSCGHEWRESIAARSRGVTCPICYAMGAGYEYLSRRVRKTAKNTPARLKCDVVKARRKIGMTQADLALLLGMERDAVSAIENGKSEPTVGFALVMADILDARVEDIFHVVKGGYALIDLTNERFGALVVKRRLPEKRSPKDDSVVWACLCDCGTYCEARSIDLRKGRAVDCGCGLGKRQPNNGDGASPRQRRKR